MRRVSRLPRWPRGWAGVRGWIPWPLVARLALAALTAGVLSALVFTHIDLTQAGAELVQVRPGQPLPRDVVAQEQVVWQDLAETELRRAEAAGRIPTQYAPDPQAAPAAVERAFAIFALPPGPETDAELLTLNIPAGAVSAARALDPAGRAEVRTATKAVVGELVARPIPTGPDMAAYRPAARDLAAQRIADPARADLTADIAYAVLRATSVRDLAATEEMRRAAREAVPPVTRTFNAGEVVLRKGALVTADDIAQMRDTGLLPPPPWVLAAPVLALMLLGAVTLGAYLRTVCPQVYTNGRRLLLLALLLVAPVWATVTFGGEERDLLVGLIAVPAAVMAIAGLLGTPAALMSAVLIVVTAALPAHHQFAFALLTLGASLAGMMAVGAIWPASRAVPAVLILTAVYLVLLLSSTTLTPGAGSFLSTFWTRLPWLALDALAGGVFSTVGAVGAIYLLARPFGITTPYRLMELTDVREPLLRRMAEEAPGSYHSSVMVAGMAEAAADAVGANALLARVAALYHDIGKLERPGFFVENQGPLGVANLHAKLSPRLSYLVLTSHVRDGVSLARRHRLPDEVTAVIREHHGTTLAAYFYHRALSEAGDQRVNEQDFRYPGPRPSSREAGIVMLADSVQASVKAIKEPTPARIEHMVAEIINSRLTDGQLEECDLTLRDLRRIREVFVRILTGLYTYTRIEYPDIKRESARSHVNLDTPTTPPARGAEVPAPRRG